MLETRLLEVPRHRERVRQWRSHCLELLPALRRWDSETAVKLNAKYSRHERISLVAEYKGGYLVKCKQPFLVSLLTDIYLFVSNVCVTKRSDKIISGKWVSMVKEQTCYQVLGLKAAHHIRTTASRASSLSLPKSCVSCINSRISAREKLASFFIVFHNSRIDS